MAERGINATDILNQTVIDTLGQTTHFLEHVGNKVSRRVIYDNVRIAVGILVTCFNFLLLVLYALSKIKRTTLHQRLSFMMLVLVVFSLIHGVVFSVVYTLQRKNRYTMTESACVVSTLIIEFCDLFVVVLLPALTLERLLQMTTPLIQPTKRRIILSLTLVLLLVVTASAAWIHMVPELEVKQNTYNTKHEDQKKHLSKFYKAYSCNQRLNRLNWMNSYALLGTELACIVLSVIFFLIALALFRSQTRSLRHMTEESKLNIRNINCSIFVVCSIVVLTNLPYAILEVIRKNCENLPSDGAKNICSSWGIELRFVFRLWFHFGNFLVPMALIFSNRNMRQSVVELLHSIIKRQNEVLLDNAYYTDHTVEINLTKPVSTKQRHLDDYNSNPSYSES